MVYLLQAEEREISYELLQDLALVLAESPGTAFADATRTIHTSHGILEFESRAEAERVCARVAGLGFRTFVIDHLLDPPEPELLHVKTAKVTEGIELAAAAQVHTVTERMVTTYNPLRVLSTDRQIAWLPGSTVEDEWIEETDTAYYLDLFAGPHHWRLEEESAGPYLEFVKGLALSDATLGIGVRNLLEGNRALPRFTSEHDYDRYLTWLYHLRYAER